MLFPKKQAQNSLARCRLSKPVPSAEAVESRGEQSENHRAQAPRCYPPHPHALVREVKGFGNNHTKSSLSIACMRQNYTTGSTPNFAGWSPRHYVCAYVSTLTQNNLAMRRADLPGTSQPARLSFCRPGLHQNKSQSQAGQFPG